MSEYINNYDRFCDELDELVLKWRTKPEDDKLSQGQCVGALLFAAHNVMQDAREDNDSRKATE